MFCRVVAGAISSSAAVLTLVMALPNDRASCAPAVPVTTNSSRLTTWGAKLIAMSLAPTLTDWVSRR